MQPFAGAGPPPAWHLAREALAVIIRFAGQAPCRWRPLSSNVRPHTTHFMPRLPWVGPLLPSALHLPIAFAWAVISSHEAPGAVLAWQVVAWPLAAFVCLATMSPVLWLLARLSLSLPGGSQIRLVAGLCFSVAASLAFLLGPQGAGSLVAAWFLALVAALAFEQWRGVQTRTPSSVRARSEA